MFAFVTSNAQVKRRAKPVRLNAWLGVRGILERRRLAPLSVCWTLRRRRNFAFGAGAVDANDQEDEAKW